MDFIGLVNGLQKIREIFPDMTLQIDEHAWGSAPRVVISIPVPAENARLLRQAQQMFAPRQPEPWESSYSDNPPF